MSRESRVVLGNLRSFTSTRHTRSSSHSLTETPPRPWRTAAHTYTPPTSPSRLGSFTICPCSADPEPHFRCRRPSRTHRSVHCLLWNCFVTCFSHILHFNSLNFIFAIGTPLYNYIYSHHIRTNRGDPSLYPGEFRTVAAPHARWVCPILTAPHPTIPCPVPYPSHTLPIPVVRMIPPFPPTRLAV